MGIAMSLLSPRHIFFPYCLDQLEDKTWVILNRNYKPVGSSATKFVDYTEAVDPSIRIAKITPTQARRISCRVDEASGSRLYLYDDGCIPTDSPANMAAYLQRLSALMSLKTT